MRFKIQTYYLVDVIVRTLNSNKLGTTDNNQNSSSNPTLNKSKPCIPNKDQLNFIDAKNREVTYK
jgi:hypothetical protein